jgi:glycerol-3-phosphate dehydrogenase
VTVAARAILNATGPFVDELRRLDDPAAEPMLTASSGVHIVLDARFAPPATGLLIPQTEDGRVLFLLPWLGHTLVGTTDQSAPVVDDPQATEEEIAYILRHVAQYFDLPVGRDDVKAAWSGLRPLVSDPASADTARLSRDHVINVSDSALVTIAGGKWTTYRRMAQDAIDAAVEAGGLDAPQPSATLNLELVGAERLDPTGAGALQERGFDADVAAHLHAAYGDRAGRVADIAEASDLRDRLVEGHPFIEAEVVYARRHELALDAHDVLDRRTRLRFLDAAAAETATPRVEALLRSSA